MAKDFSHLAIAPGMEEAASFPFSGIVFGEHFPTTPHFVEGRQTRDDTLAARLVRKGALALAGYRTGSLGLLIDSDKPKSDRDKPENVMISFARNIDKLVFDQDGNARFHDVADVVTKRTFPLSELETLADGQDALHAGPMRDSALAQFMARLGGNLLINTGAADAILALLDNRLDHALPRGPAHPAVPFHGIRFRESFPGMAHFSNAHATQERALEAELKKNGNIVVPGYRGLALGLIVKGGPDNSVGFDFITDADAIFSGTRRGKLDNILRNPQAPAPLLRRLASLYTHRDHSDLMHESAQARFIALLGEQKVLLSRPTAGTLLKLLANRFGRT